MERQKVLQCQNKMARVRDGFEGGLYSLDEARAKVNGYRELTNKAEQEIERLTGVMGEKNRPVNVEELRKELERLAQQNLEQATFGEKRDMINKLGIKVYPSEDLKTMRVRCSLDFGDGNNGQSPDRCVIIPLGSLRSQ